MFTVTKHDDTDDDDDVTEEKELREEEEHARLWLILLFASAASSALIVLMPASEMAKCVYGSTSHRPTMPYRLSLKKYIQNQTPHTHHKKSFFVTWRYDSFHSSRDHEQRWKHQRVLVLRGWIVCRNAGASVVFFFLVWITTRIINSFGSRSLVVCYYCFADITAYSSSSSSSSSSSFYKRSGSGCGSIGVLLRQCDQRFGR